MKTKEQAIMEIAQDILADPLWSARVVAAAIVAEDSMSADQRLNTAAGRVLSNALQGLKG